MISYATFLMSMTAGTANAQTGSTDLPRVADDTPPALTSSQHPNLKALPPPNYHQRATSEDRADPTEPETAKSSTQPSTTKGASATGGAAGQAQPAVHGD